MATTRNPKRLGVVLASVAVLTAVAAGAASAINGADDAQDRAIPGAERERAERAALLETGGGTVTGTEIGDEESLYEVEVTQDDGTQVDVQLDEDYEVVGTETEGADANDEGDSDD